MKDDPLLQIHRDLDKLVKHGRKAIIRAVPKEQDIPVDEAQRERARRLWKRPVPCIGDHKATIDVESEWLRDRGLVAHPNQKGKMP